MLWLQTTKTGSGTMNLGGSLTRQVTIATDKLTTDRDTRRDRGYHNNQVISGREREMGNHSDRLGGFYLKKEAIHTKTINQATDETECKRVCVQ